MPRLLPSRQFVKRVALFLLILYLGFGTLLIANETKFIYVPFNGPSDPQKAGAPSYARHEFMAESASQYPIVYWESSNKTLPTLLYFHGNGGGLYTHTLYLNALARRYHVIALEYPSYPGALGKPSQQQIGRNARALYDHVMSKTPPIIWGISLGSGVAVQLAAERPARAVILEAPFTAIVDRAGEMFPLYPVAYLMSEQYRSRERMADIQAPVFIMHGEDDNVIPVSHGRALYMFANEPKMLRTYPHFGHMNLISSPAYDDAFKFIEQHQN